MRAAIIAALAGLASLSEPAFALDKVTFATNWLADPEAGGYYQALVDGTYENTGSTSRSCRAGRPRTAACCSSPERSSSSWAAT